MVCDETDSKCKNINSILQDSHVARKDCFALFTASQNDGAN